VIEATSVVAAIEVTSASVFSPIFFCERLRAGGVDIFSSLPAAPLSEAEEGAIGIDTAVAAEKLRFDLFLT
jgi:hypothetical protein